MSRKKTVILLLAFVVLMAAAIAGYNRLSAVNTPVMVDNTVKSTPSADAPSADLPDFTVTDVHGREVHLSDFYGKPVVINIWATWCPPCRSELPAFNALNKELGEDVVFMMVDCTDGARDTVEGVKSFLVSNGYTFPVYCDISGDAAALYGASSIPMTIMIAPDGTEVFRRIGALQESELRAAVNDLLTR